MSPREQIEPSFDSDDRPATMIWPSANGATSLEAWGNRPKVSHGRHK
jgi:hypothetical protein